MTLNVINEIKNVIWFYTVSLILFFTEKSTNHSEVAPVQLLSTAGTCYFFISYM